jgi:hypothetical protein
MRRGPPLVLPSEAAALRRRASRALAQAACVRAALPLAAFGACVLVVYTTLAAVTAEGNAG